MKKVDLENNYIRNDIVTTIGFEEMMETFKRDPRSIQEHKARRRHLVRNAIDMLILAAMFIALLVYVFTPGGYGW